MCAELRSVCGICVVKGAPKRICIVVRTGTARRERIKANIIVCFSHF